VVIAERTVTNLLARYEELVALHLTNRVRLRECLTTQGYVVLALDGLQPDVGARQSYGCYVTASQERSFWLAAC
jgi:hypothetical protein